MQGPAKALLDFGGEPLLQRIRARIAPQTSRILLNLGTETEEYDHFGLPICYDLKPDRGPLMGLASAFKLSGGKQDIALCPCDAPFVPPGLVAEQIYLMDVKNADVVCPRYKGQFQPAFALWHHRMAERVISAATQEGVGGLQALYPELALAILDWPEEDPDPFFNINEPGDLSLALDYLEKQE